MRDTPSSLLDGEEPNWDELLEYNKDDGLALKAVVDELGLLIYPMHPVDFG